jgi:hypothetical protein
VPPKEKKFKGYFKIARHYGWALNHTFFKFNFDTVIIVEGKRSVRWWLQSTLLLSSGYSINLHIQLAISSP